jgi:hypothetical protein
VVLAGVPQLQHGPRWTHGLRLRRRPWLKHGQRLHEGAAAKPWAVAELRATAATRAAAELLVLAIGGANTPQNSV